MNLSPEDAERIKTMGQAAEWATLPDDDVRKSLWTLLGVNNDSLVKVIGISPQAEYDSVLTNWKVPTADGSPHPPSLAQRGQAGLVGRACRVACGMESGTLSLAAPPVASNTSAGDAAASPKKKIKLSSVIDQTNDAEEHLLDRTKIAEAYQRFKTALGDFPPHDEEPTGEQLTALHAVVGSGAPPYVDLAVWGPHQYRLLKKLKLRGMQILPNGEFQVVEMAGPGSFEQWESCFRVFRAAAVMLGILTPARCDAYLNMLKKYHSRYGSTVWHLLFQADVRARQEHWERCRRIGAEAKAQADAAGTSHDFNPAKPWEWALRALIEDNRFWKEELEDPCLLVISRSTPLSSVVEGDAPTTSTTRAPEQQQQPKKKPGLKLKKEQRLHNVSEGQYVTNRRGVELCRDFNKGTCCETNKYGRCAKDANRVHQCSLCLSTEHGAHSCTKPPPSANVTPKGKVKGGGKGGAKTAK